MIVLGGRYVAVAVAIAAALAGPAQAQDGGSPRVARLEFDRGVRAAAAGNYDKALQYYRRSYQTMAHPRTMFNLAAIADHLGRYEEAFHAYRNFLSTATGRDRELVRDAEQRVDVLARRLRAPVRIESTPVGASVFVDGNPRSVGITPLELRLTPGGHVLRLVASGRQTAQLPVEIAPLIEQTQKVTLPVAQASLHIRAEPRAAEITVDGVPIGTTPLIGGGRLDHGVAPGLHRVVASRDGYLRIDRTVDVAGPDHIDIDVVLRPPRSRANKVVLGTVFAVGLAAVATGAVLGIQVLADHRELRGVTDAVLWPGVAVTAGAVIGWYRTRPEPSEIQVQPSRR